MAAHVIIPILASECARDYRHAHRPAFCTLSVWCIVNNLFPNSPQRYICVLGVRGKPKDTLAPLMLARGPLLEF